MRRTLPLLIAVLLGPVAGSRGADSEIKAVLQKALKAHGGAEALLKYKATQAKSKGKIKLPGVGEIEFTQEVSTLQPDKFKETLELQIGGKKISVVTLVNGDKLSIEADGKAVEINDAIKNALKDAQYMMKAARLVSLVKDKGYDLAGLGEIKVEGKPAIGVRVSSKGHKDVNLFFDKETGLLSKVEFRGNDPMTGKERTEERIILDYGPKGKEGIPTPRKVLVKYDGEQFLEAEVTEAKILETLDDSTFAK